MSHGPDPRLMIAQLCGERDGIKARAVQLAGEVRRVSVSMHVAEKDAGSAKREASKLRDLLREIRECGALEGRGDLQIRVAEFIGEPEPKTNAKEG